MGGGCEFLWDCRSGASKAISRSGLICLPGEVLDLYERGGGGLNESYPFRVCRRGLEAIL